jgi:hypothetical protein
MKSQRDEMERPLWHPLVTTTMYDKVLTNEEKYATLRKDLTWYYYIVFMVYMVSMVLYGVITRQTYTVV